MLANLAAAYGFGLAKNHAFVMEINGSPLAAIGISLDIDGYELIAPPADAVAMILGVAASGISEAELTSWIGVNSRHLEL
jgi:death on curing protein